MTEVTKTVWIVNQYAYTPDDSASTRHFSYARALRDRGHDVHVVSSTYYHKGRRQRHTEPGKPFVLKDIEGVPFAWVRSLPYRRNAVRFFNMVDFARRIAFGTWRRHLPRPDVIIATSPSPFTAYAAMRLARKLNARFVVEVVDIWPETLVEVSNLSRSHPVVTVIGWLERRLMTGAEKVLTHLGNAHAHFVTVGATRDKCVYIPSPLVLPDTPLTEPPTERDRPFRFIHAGSLSASYAPGQLLDAVEILLRDRPDLQAKVTVDFLGEGPLMRGLVARTQSMGLDDIVTFRGVVPKAQIITALQKADAFLLLSGDLALHRFGISYNKIFDYMLAGRPVVMATNDAETPITKAGSGTLQPPESPADLARAMIEMIETPRAKRIAMGAAGYAYVRANHTLAHWAERAEAELLL